MKFTYTLHPKDMKQKPFTRTNMYWSSTDIAERSVDEIYQIVKLWSKTGLKVMLLEIFPWIWK